MKKKVLVALSMVVLAVTFVTGSVMAIQPPGEDPSPIDSIWTEIARLWDAIDNVEHGLSINWYGAYNDSQAYTVNDAVSYEGSSYICVADSTANPPTDSTYWDLLASQGDTGTAGTNGTNGADGADGISIHWLGSHGSAPSNPSLNNAYYDSTEKKSYIYDGDSWEILCQDGASGSGGTATTPIMWSGGSTTYGGKGLWEVYRTDGMDFNTAGSYITTTGDGYFTVTVPGFYRINAQATGWGSSNHYIRLVVNGLVVHWAQSYEDNAATRNIGIDLNWPLNAGDAFCVEYYIQAGSGAYSYCKWTSTDAFSRLQVSYEGPLP